MVSVVQLVISSALLLVALLFGSPTVLANSIQVAPTVSFIGAEDVDEGVVVVVDDTQGLYSISGQSHQANVFGVTAVQPALVFQTGEQEVPVITNGQAFVQVNTEGGNILRGDVLTTAQSPGVARKATTTESHVFAVALENYQADTVNQTGLVQADVSVERATLALEAKRQAQADTPKDDPDPVSIVRATVAVLLVVGGLFFVLYSFRSTIKAGVVSVGRNPRARSAIVALSIGNLTFALILCALVVFIAVAILILPV